LFNFKPLRVIFSLNSANLGHGIIALTILFSPHSLLAIINGKAANEKRFDAVGSLKIGKNGKVGCTATLIAENWIVTADHCIHETTSTSEEDIGKPLLPSQYEFRLGNDFKKPFFKSSMKRWVSGPKINNETLDIAFGELSQSVPTKKLGLNLIIASTQQWVSRDLQDIYWNIGYGVLEAFTNKKFPLSNKRQLAQLTVTATGGNALLNLFGNSENLRHYINKFHPEAFEAGTLEAIIANGELLPQYSIHAWDAHGREDLINIKIPEGGWQDTCFGDSGGPLLREVEGQLRIMGVVSQGMDRICSPLGTRFTIFGPEVKKLMQELSIPIK